MLQDRVQSSPKDLTGESAKFSLDLMRSGGSPGAGWRSSPLFAPFSLAASASPFRAVLQDCHRLCKYGSWTVVMCLPHQGRVSAQGC